MWIGEAATVKRECLAELRHGRQSVTIAPKKAKPAPRLSTARNTESIMVMPSKISRFVSAATMVSKRTTRARHHGGSRASAVWQAPPTRQ